MMVRQTVIYGTIVGINTTNLKTIQFELDTIQRLAYVGVIGASAVLKGLLVLNPQLS